MTTTDIFNLFLLVSAIHGFAFSIILFYSKNGRSASMLFLNLMILTISLNNIQSWVLEKHLFQDNSLLNYIEIPWHFLSIPFFYMFLVNYVNIVKKTFNILKIIIPLFVIATVAQILFVIQHIDVGTPDELDIIFERYTTTEEIISFTSSLLIFVYTYYILYKKDFFSSKILLYDNLSWIKTFFKFLILGYFLWISAIIIKFSLNFTGFIFSYYPLRVYTTILIYWLGYQGLRHIRVLKERRQIREHIYNTKKAAAQTQEEEEEENTSEISQKFKEQFSEIDTFIRTRKKFLQPKYTLQNLAKDTKIGASTLSAIINNGAEKTFTDYINELRVAQAKKLLVDKKYADYTIVSIGLESGFNSKSTFYNVFKKHTGCTPLAYKDSPC